MEIVKTVKPGIFAEGTNYLRILSIRGEAQHVTPINSGCWLHSPSFVFQVEYIPQVEWVNVAITGSWKMNTRHGNTLHPTLLILFLAHILVPGKKNIVS